jgi:signal transduction histidine kinase
MSVIEKLKEAVRSVVQERQDLYAEARLNDGRVIATEAEQFSAGASVRVLSEDGEAAPLEAGTYELSDGGEVTVDAESNVVEMMEEDEEKTEAAEHEEEKDEMAAVKAALVEHFQISEEVAEQIVEVVKDAMVPKEVEAEEEKKEEEMEEEEKEEMSEDKTEMSSHVQDLTHEMAVALEAINKRLEKLEEAPAAQPDRVLPKQEFKKEINPNTDGVDRALNIINQFS